MIEPLAVDITKTHAADSHIPLHQNAGFDCEDGSLGRQHNIVNRERIRRRSCAFCCAIVAACGAVWLIGLFIVDPLIKSTSDDSMLRDHAHGSRFGKMFALPHARMQRPVAQNLGRLVPPSMQAVAATPPAAIIDGPPQDDVKPSPKGRPIQLPKIAVIGRPNVGKSALVNRMTKKFDNGAIVFDVPGVTRDRTYADGWWNEHDYTVIDTGGLVFDDKDGEVWVPQIRQQAQLALNEASVVLFVVDGQSGPSPLDEEIAVFLRRQRLPVVLAVTKCESVKGNLGELQAAEFWSLGMGTPFAVSGIHGTGTGEMMDALVSHFPPREEHDDVGGDMKELRVAILGRPNVGKSSLLNRWTGTNRSIVCDKAGTTCDAIDQSVRNFGTTFTFIDTAGVRKIAKVEKGLEQLMVRRAFKAARRADVVLIVIDASQGPSEQDNRLAEYVRDSGRACVVVVNKWDLVPNKNDRMYRDSRRYLENRLPAVAWATPVFISALTGLRSTTIFKAIRTAAEQHRRRITTSVINEVLEEGIRWQKPPTTKTAKQGTVYYCAQVSSQPPTIAIFCNDPDLFPDTYRRYLEKHFRQAFGFDGTPLRLLFKGKKQRDLTRGK